MMCSDKKSLLYKQILMGYDSTLMEKMHGLIITLANQMLRYFISWCLSLVAIFSNSA